jgi:uncharacterized membrane protein
VAPQIQPKARLTSIDALRGLVMIIMALDHVRDFFHADANLFQPDNLARTTTALFFTRWITHFCAPTFMFTAGLGAFFWLRGGRTKGELSAFLWKRGLWLILLEFTIERLGLDPTFVTAPVYLIVLWSLGWAMIALAAAIHLPPRVVAAISIATIALHNLADPIKGGWLWMIIHQQGAFQVGGVTVIAGYPLIPWIAVMSLGYCFGPIVRDRRKLMLIGLGMSAAFVVLRAINVYGDPSPWNGTGLLSFLRCTKQPPSLDYLLMTLGPAILVLSWFDRLSFTETNPLIVFGRVPLFYFLLHLLVAHLLGMALGETHHLWAVYILWISVVAMLYPVCLWYMRLKKRNRSPLLSYM